jgi:hypothetical protein
LHARITPNEREKALGQSYEGRLWDVVFLASFAARRSGTQDRCSFEVSLFEADEAPPHRTHRRTLSLWMVVGPGDQGEPVITIGFPEDFREAAMTGKTNPGLPAPFENTYFRERAIKAANRQKQGHILVSGAKPDNGQGLPLPYIHDVPGLRRGSYPYDYECEWGRFKYEYELSSYLFTPHNGQVPPGWERYDLQTPIQPVTAVIDRARRLATVKTKDREIVLRDVPVGESPYNLLQQVNAALAQSCQPFVAWRLEWVSGEVDRLWPDGVPQIRNEHGSAYVTGYAHDEAGNLIYLGMVGHKTVLESIRATIQARQRKKLFLQGRGRSTRCHSLLPDLAAPAGLWCVPCDADR